MLQSNSTDPRKTAPLCGISQASGEMASGTHESDFTDLYDYFSV